MKVTAVESRADGYRKLKVLDSARCAATDLLNKKLLDMFPLGASVAFKIMTNQYNESTGKVIAHEAPCVRIRIDSPTGKVIDIHFAKTTLLKRKDSL